MKILVLHRVPYYKIEYHRGINHDTHEVTYVGLHERIGDLPPGLNCKKLVRQGVERTAREVLDVIPRNENFDRVISVSEYELMDAAIIREVLGVPGPRPVDVEKVRNKVAMKRAVQDHGIATPRWIRADEAVSRSLELLWEGKVVLKPVDGASSQDVTVHRTVEEALARLEVYRSHGKNPEKFELEEYVEGAILHMDGLVSNGVIQCFVASQYIGTCLDYARGKPLGSFQIEHRSEHQDWAQRCISAVGIQNSAFHLEAIQKGDQLVFLEVGARVGGGDVVDTFELATGIHLPSEELKLYLNEPVSIRVSAPYQSQFGWFVFPGHHLPGPFSGVHGFDAYKFHPGMVRWNALAAGAPLFNNITYQSREVPLAGLVRGETSFEVKTLIQEIFENVN